jgi:hypothetical protein
MVRSINPIVGLVSKKFRHKQAMEWLHKGGSCTKCGVAFFLYRKIAGVFISGG